jgi:hypothetical protein
VKRLVLLGIVAGTWGVLLACSKENAAIDKGGECFFASDCAPGLICVEQRDKGIRICTDDLSGVAGEPPGMEEGDASDEAGEGGQTDAPVVVSDTGADQNVGTDTGVQDTGVDTGQPPVDSAAD